MVACSRCDSDPPLDRRVGVALIADASGRRVARRYDGREVSPQIPAGQWDLGEATGKAGRCSGGRPGPRQHADYGKGEPLRIVGHKPPSRTMRIGGRRQDIPGLVRVPGITSAAPRGLSTWPARRVATAATSTRTQSLCPPPDETTGGYGWVMRS